MTDFSDAVKTAADAASAANVFFPTIRVSLETPEGVKTTIELGSEQLRQTPWRMPGPADLDPSSPEAAVMHLFKEGYGDGSLIFLDKEDSQFEEKAQALRESNRRFDQSARGWVRKD